MSRSLAARRWRTLVGRPALTSAATQPASAPAGADPSAASVGVRDVGPLSAGERPGPPRADAVVARLASRRFGVVARSELIAAGLTRHQITGRLADGRLHRLHEGVYAVGHQALRPEGIWWAAVLAGGPGAVLSHRSAALLWGLPWFDHDRVEITVRRDRARQPTVHAHRGRLTEADVTRRRGIPVTAAPRLLLDLAEGLTADQLDRALDEAVRLRLYDPIAVDELIGRSPGRRGLRALRRARARVHPNSGRTRSELERIALRLLNAHAVPRPDANDWRHGYRVDLIWRGPRVVVELDSYEFHRSPGAFERDHARDNHLLDAGYAVRRFTWHDVTDDGPRTARRIATLLAARIPVPPGVGDVEPP